MATRHKEDEEDSMAIEEEEEEEEKGEKKEQRALSRSKQELLQKRLVTRTPKFLRVTLENIARHRAVQLAYVDRFLLKEHEPVVGSPETILAAEERAHLNNNTALSHFTLQMTVIHHQLNTEQLPTGDVTQRLFFRIAARPPFAANGLERSAVANQLCSLTALESAMLASFALYLSGLLRLRKDLYLCVFEWRTENNCHSCVALVLSVPERVGRANWLPDNDTLSFRNVPAPLAQAPVFQYNGYVYADSCISGAAAGAPAQ